MIEVKIKQIKDLNILSNPYYRGITNEITLLGKEKFQRYK
jgi:hypothetical protein